MTLSKHSHGGDDLIHADKRICVAQTHSLGYIDPVIIAKAYNHQYPPHL